MSILHAFFVLTITLITCLIPSRSLNAAEPEENNESDLVLLSISVKPKLCLRFTIADRCELEVLIHWRARARGKYCIYSEQSLLKPIQCWQDADTGEHTLVMRVSDDTDFWLSERENSNEEGEELARCTLEIATIVKDVKSRRNNKRHIWNLI